MNHNDSILQELGVLLAGLVEADLKPAQRDRLADILREHPDAKRFYHRYLELHTMLEWESGQAHDQAPATLANDPPLDAFPITLFQQQDTRTLSRRQYTAALSYVLRRTFTPKRIATLATAAALLMGIALGVVLLTSPDQDEPFAEVQNPPAPEVEAEGLSPIVATLTASHNAVWDSPQAEGALAPGSELTAGTRLTLTAGFAEITTKRGAIAVLEAPATIELIDSPNALRLHAGKLVGICETESSQGFLVRTPHLDITDLGTRFGVETNPKATEALVFEGEIETRRPDTPAGVASIRLVADESVRAAADSDIIARIDHRADRFASMLYRTGDLPGTGVGLANGQIDPAWAITVINGNALEEPIQPSVLTVNQRVLDAHGMRGAQRLNWTPPLKDGKTKNQTFRFETRVSLPDDLDAASARIVAQLRVDNNLKAVIVNGHRIELTQDFDDQAVRPYVIDRHLRPGENVIGFDILNIKSPRAEGNPVGLIVSWQWQDKRRVN